MKSKKLIILLLGIILLLSIVTGSSSIKLNLYKSEMSSSISSKWNNSKSVIRLNGSNDEISLSSVPFIVVYKSKKIGDTMSPNPVKIDISDKDFGSLWFPLIKKSHYNFNVTCKDKQEILTNSAIGKLIINGDISVSGNYKIIGFCSKETATGIIVEKVMNDIYAEIKKNAK